MSALDLALTFAVVFAAASFLVFQLAGRGPKPACHTTSTTAARTEPDVIIGAALQRGLDRAKRK